MNSGLTIRAPRLLGKRSERAIALCSIADYHRLKGYAQISRGILGHQFSPMILLR